MYYIGSIPFDPNYLRHYGAKGMHWGVRHWQYYDGRFNEAGKLRYFGASSPNRPPSVKEQQSPRLTKREAESTISSRHVRNKTSNSGGKSSSVSDNRENKNGKRDKHKSSSRSNAITDVKKRFKNYWTEDRKETAKKAAIVAGVVAASVVAYKVAKPQMMEVEAGANFLKTRYATQMSRTTMSMLDDNDTVLKAGTEVQRIIRDYNNPQKAIEMDSARNFIYGAVDDTDKQIYRALFRSKGEGKDMITTRKLVNDLVMPSPQKRVSSFVESLNDKAFAEAFVNDLKSIGQIGANKKLTADELLSMTPKQKQALYSRFNMIAGDSRSESAKMYFGKIRNMGYNALIDDNDGGFLSKSPIIFLNADKDTVVIGERYATKLEKYMDGINLKHIYGRGSSLTLGRMR